MQAAKRYYMSRIISLWHDMLTAYLLQVMLYSQGQSRAIHLHSTLSCVGGQSRLPFPVICDIWVIHMQLEVDGQRILPAQQKVLCNLQPREDGLSIAQGPEARVCELWIIHLTTLLLLTRSSPLYNSSIPWINLKGLYLQGLHGSVHLQGKHHHTDISACSL